MKLKFQGRIHFTNKIINYQMIKSILLIDYGHFYAC